MVESDKKNTTRDGALPDAEQYLAKNPEHLARNIALAAEAFAKATALWAKTREEDEAGDIAAAPLADMVRVFSQISAYWLGDPARALDAQTRLFSQFMGLWFNSIQQLSEENTDAFVESDAKDNRFRDPEWGRNAFFSFLKQAYLILAHWAEDLVERTEELDAPTRQKARFYVNQITLALSPSNFLLTNPELLRETMASNGENLVRGMQAFCEDMIAGKGDLKLRQSDSSKFELGENIATTPGKVIARSALAEIIQYEPSTKDVLKRPLLVVPPWINKYYILDLNAKRSFIRWAVEQGHTVFVISWINPGKEHAAKGWDEYISDGIEFALDAIEDATGENSVNAVGYCVGGTLLATSLALMAKENDARIVTASFFATQVDFTHAGDLKVFVDEAQLAALESSMQNKGYLDANRMATAFNMLRARELIWPYVVNNYLRGQEPLAFDLLHWNADSTRQTAACHAYYLRNCYLENGLSQGTAMLRGQKIALGDIQIPIFNLATRDDHIAPARSVFLGGGLFGGKVEHVLAGSGHIAGVVNPPALNKYRYWTGGSLQTGVEANVEASIEKWLETAHETPGSWWPYWQNWIEKTDDLRVPARKPGITGKILGNAPGDYVKMRS